MSDHPQDDEQQPLLGEDSAGPAEHSESPSFNSRLKTALHNPLRLNGLEKALAALAVLLLLLTSVGWGLFAGEATKLGRERREHRHSGEHNRPTATITATSTIAAPTSTSVPPTHPPKAPGKGVSRFFN